MIAIIKTTRLTYYNKGNESNNTVNTALLILLVTIND